METELSKKPPHQPRESATRFSTLELPDAPFDIAAEPAEPRLPMPSPMPAPVPKGERPRGPVPKTDDPAPAPKRITPESEITAQLIDFARKPESLEKIRLFLSGDPGKAGIEVHASLREECKKLFDVRQLPLDKRHQFEINATKLDLADGSQMVRLYVFLNAHEDAPKHGLIATVTYVKDTFEEVKLTNPERLRQGANPERFDRRLQFPAVKAELDAMNADAPIETAQALKIARTLRDFPEGYKDLSVDQAKKLDAALSNEKSEFLIRTGLWLRMGYSPNTIIQHCKNDPDVTAFIHFIADKNPSIVAKDPEQPVVGDPMPEKRVVRSFPPGAEWEARLSPEEVRASVQNITANIRSGERDEMRNAILQSSHRAIAECDAGDLSAALRKISNGIRTANKDALARVIASLYHLDREKLNQVVAMVNAPDDKYNIWYIKNEIGNRLGREYIDALYEAAAKRR